MATVAETQTNQRSRFALPNRNTLREWLQGYLFASPFIIGFFAFIAFPMGYSIVLAFQKWNLLAPPRFVGLANFEEMLFNDPDAWLSLWNSAFYTILSLIHI